MKPRRGRRRRDHDTKTPDGWTCAGWRLVHRGGYVRFSHLRHHYAVLRAFVGQWVFVQANCPYGTEIDVWLDAPYSGRRLHRSGGAEAIWDHDSPEPFATSLPLPAPR